MFSLLVCSVHPNFLSTLKKSVAETIGVEYELLVWDNTERNAGLSLVYNNLAGKARYPFLCFVHEDLLFETSNWGKYLLNIFDKDDKIGLIGVAGGKYKSRLYSGWYAGTDGLDFYNVTHQTPTKKFQLSYPPKWNNSEEQVATIDGVFMACRKSIWQQTKFNDNLLKGFHFYDIDFSLRVAQANKVMVTNNIQLIHLNKGGDYGDKWVEQAFIFHNKHKHLLPHAIIPVDINEADIRVADYWLDWLKNQKISFNNKLRWICDQQLLSHRELWYSIAKFLFYRPLRLKKIHYLFNRKK